MNRILVAASHVPSPFVLTHAVPEPVLRGAAKSITIETSEGQEYEVSLPHTLDPSVQSLRVLRMSNPAIIVMETGHAHTE